MGAGMTTLQEEQLTEQEQDLMAILNPDEQGINEKRNELQQDNARLFVLKL